MSVLDSVLQEEYERSERMKSAMESELNELPKGYVSEKKIAGKSYYYLQERIKMKIVGTYIPTEELTEVKKRIDRRKQLEESIRELKANMKKIRRVIK
jgi:hypothetical protein